METIDSIILLGALDFTKLIFWILIGIAAGFLARAILPGEQKMGKLATMALGIGGALLGGWVATVVDFFPKKPVWDLIIATIGAFVLLIIFVLINKIFNIKKNRF